MYYVVKEGVHGSGEGYIQRLYWLPLKFSFLQRKKDMTRGGGGGGRRVESVALYQVFFEVRFIQKLIRVHMAIIGDLAVGLHFIPTWGGGSSTFI